MTPEALHAEISRQSGDKLVVGRLVEILGEIFQSQPLYYGHGTDNPHDEAYALVFTVLGYGFDDPDSYWSNTVSADDIYAIVDVASQRISKRIPLAYLTGKTWFAGLPFHIDQRALIPRSPFAELIQDQFHPWIQSVKGLKILDMCTGNGCIGIASAVYLPGSQVDIVDLSAEALLLAKQNVELHQMQDRVEIIQSDLFSELAGRQYDLIVSNPPYVPASSMAELPVEYGHEPVMALQADDEGMAIVDRILQQAASHLTEEGVLIVEVGEIADAVHERYQRLPFIWLEFEFGGEGVFLLRREDLAGLNNGKS